jgi:YegS/Rv2252/BmrU family lipid kinase
VTERQAALAAVAGSGIFVGIVILILSGWPPLVGLDRAIARGLASLFDHPVAIQALLVIANLTAPWVLRGVSVIVAAVLLRRGSPRLAAWLLATVAFGVVLEYGMKILIGRPRPPVAAVPVPASALPSGHALTSALVVGAFLLVLSRPEVSRRVRVAGWSTGIAFVLVVGFDRVALAVHYLSDVLAGWALAVGALGLTVLVGGVARRFPRPRGTRRFGSRQRVAVIVNPSKVEDDDYVRYLVERQAARSGWAEPLWFETTPDDPGHAMAHAALEAKVDLVIAAGGDGTVRVVCAELAGTGVPVGILPVGTGNLLVRNLGLPLDLSAAVRVALTGRDRALDLVRVEGDQLATDRFAVMAGLGLDAAVVGEAPPKLKARMGWAAYVVSIVRNLSFPAVRVEIAVDDEPPVRRWVRTVLVGNVGTLHGGLSLLPNARPDDGLLDVVAVAPRRLTDWPALAWRVVRRSRGQDERLRTWRGRRVVIRAEEACPRQLDGDVIEFGHELRCEVEPGVLLVRVPADR